MVEPLTNRRSEIKTLEDDPLEEPYEAVCQCSSKGCKWEFKDKNPCEDITEITCPSPDFNLWPPEVTLTCAKENKELFYKVIRIRYLKYDYGFKRSGLKEVFKIVYFQARIVQFAEIVYLK